MACTLILKISGIDEITRNEQNFRKCQLQNFNAIIIIGKYITRDVIFTNWMKSVQARIRARQLLVEFHPVGNITTCVISFLIIRIALKVVKCNNAFSVFGSSITCDLLYRTVSDIRPDIKISKVFWVTCVFGRFFQDSSVDRVFVASA